MTRNQGVALDNTPVHLLGKGSLHRAIVDLPDPAIGPDRLHYARLHDVHLFTTPRVVARLQELLAAIEDLYQAEPARCTSKP